MVLPRRCHPERPLAALRAQLVMRSTTAVWVLVNDEDAEAIRADLSAGNPGHACDLLLNRAIELLPSRLRHGPELGR